MPNIEQAKVIDALLQKAGELLMSNGAVRCINDTESSATKDSCVTQQEKAYERRHKNTGFHQFDPEKMCDACAAYWHTTCAHGRLLWAIKRGLSEKEE